MIKRYVVWDKTSPIYTIGPDEHGHAFHEAADYIKEKAPWATKPETKVIVHGGILNGMVFQEWDATIAHYIAQGCHIDEENWTDREILDAIEYFEDHPPVSDEPSFEERTAAALEFLCLNSI